MADRSHSGDHASDMRGNVLRNAPRIQLYSLSSTQIFNSLKGCSFQLRKYQMYFTVK